MSDAAMALALPSGLSLAHRTLLAGLTRRNDAVHGPDLLGLVLSGSAGREMATERSDLDVYVVLSDAGDTDA